MDSSITFRPFVRSDYKAVCKLWDICRLPYKPLGRDSPEAIKEELRSPTSEFWVAETDSEIIGTVFGTQDGRKGWINRLAVHPGHQRLGIAGQLIRMVETQFLQMGIHIVACLVEDWNQESKCFFESQNYELHRDIHYFSKRENSDI